MSDNRRSNSQHVPALHARFAGTCRNCGEPIIWFDRGGEWLSNADKPQMHYLNECAGHLPD